MLVELTALQARVVACLIEKGATTPDNYPLTTNALVAACNQSTNRDPVVDYSSRDVDGTMIELRQLELARAVSGVGHRSSKHKHVVGEALGLDGAQVAVLAVLTLRGPQTLNEITTRTERYLDGPEGDTDAVDSAIDQLADRPDPLVRRLERRPGEREPRIEQLWIEADDAMGAGTSVVGTSINDATPVSTNSSTVSAEATPVDRTLDLADRVASLEAELARQAARLDALLKDLGIDAPNSEPEPDPDPEN